MKYRPDIDGLRALAVLGVLFYHANFHCSGGFVGVDVFFVISGYLITGLIQKDLGDSRFSLFDFWTRRLRRIFPALSAVVLTTLVAGWFLFLPSDFAELGESVCAQALFSSNFYFWDTSGYFQSAAETKPLLHTWSLAVEEQFYLLFPFLLLALRPLSRLARLTTLAGLFALSFGLNVYCTHNYVDAGFYLLPPRAWELLLGALIASLPTTWRLPRGIAEFLSLLGFIAILCAMARFHRDMEFPGYAALLPCLGAALVIWPNSHSSTLVGNFFTLRPMVFIGLISYSLYLWHWPLLAFARYLSPTPLPFAYRATLILVSGILAVASWRFIELPFRRQLVFASRLKIWSYAGLTTTLLILAGFGVSALKGIPARLPTQALEYADTPSYDGSANLTLKQAVSGQFPTFGAEDKTLPISIFIWGDSHAMAVTPLFDALCREHSTRGAIAAHFSLLPLLNFEWGNLSWSLKKDSIPFNDAVLEFIRKNRVKNVVLIAKWGVPYYGDVPNLRQHLLDTLNALTHSGCNVWILRQVPRLQADAPKTLALAAMFHRDPNQVSLSPANYSGDRTQQDLLFQEISLPHVTILNPHDLFFDTNGRLTINDHGQSLYADDNHVSVAGAMRLKPLFEPIFEEMDKDKRHDSP